MATEFPLTNLVLSAGSVVDDLGFVAMADLSAVLADAGNVESRIIGGHMVTLHVHRWRLGRELYRETRDADLGIPPVVVRDGELIKLLRARGYKRTTGNTYEREMHDVPIETHGRAPRLAASIDILSPGDFSSASTPDTSDIVRSAFESNEAEAMRALASGRSLSLEASQRLNARIRALIQRVIG